MAKKKTKKINPEKDICPDFTKRLVIYDRLLSDISEDYDKGIRVRTPRRFIDPDQDFGNIFAWAEQQEIKSNKQILEKRLKEIVAMRSELFSILMHGEVQKAFGFPDELVVDPPANRP